MGAAMRRLISAVGAAAIVGGATLSPGPARADQEQCVNDLPFSSHVCVRTTNSGGASGDEHVVIVSGRENVPALALGFNLVVSCDDDGGASTGVLEANIGPEAPIALPVACPDLP